MRITYLFLLLLICGLTNGQNKSSKLDQVISVNIQQMELEDALFLIADKGAFNISFKPSDLSQSGLISKDFTNVKVRDLLNDLLSAELEIIDLGNNILLKRIISKSNNYQNQYFKGVVVNQVGEAVQGVLVFEVDQLVSATTNEFGKFNLKYKSSFTEDLVFSVSNKGCEDTIVRFSDYSKEHRIKLKCDLISNRNLEPLELKKALPLNVPYVLVPKKVQIVPLQSEAILFRKFQFSLLPSMGTNQLLGGVVENQYSINLIGGYSLGLTGIEFGGAFNTIGGNAKYLQLGGVFNIVGGGFEGLQIGGAFNKIGGSFRGLQLAGAYNSADSVKGLQLAGAINIAEGNVSGLQFSGLANKAKSVHGMQLSGLVNKVDSVHGFQFAPVNMAKKNNGLQFGVLNISDTAKGAMVGFVNIAKKGGYNAFEVSTSMFPHFSSSYKLGTPKLYNIYSVGGSFLEDDLFWNYGFGVGTRKINSKLRPFHSEFIFNWIFDGFEKSSNSYGLSQVKFLMASKENSKFKWNLGPSLNVLIYQPSTATNKESEITPYSITTEKIGKTNLDFWAGFQLSATF